MDIQIIPAERGHLERIYELNTLLYIPELQEIKPFIWSEIVWIEGSIEKFFVARDCAGNIIGALSLDAECNPEIMELVTIVVSKENQGRGIGKMFVSFAKNFARQHDAKKLELGTFVAYKKVEFYKSQGFCEWGFSYYQTHKYTDKFPYHEMIVTL